VKTIAKQTAAMAVIACLSLPLYAQDQEQAAGQQENKPEQQSISITKDGSLPVGQLAGKKVFVTFKNSGKLTEALADRVTNAGAEVAQSAEGADVVLEGEGVFTAVKPLVNRQAHADAGEVFEKNGYVKTKRKSLDIALSTGSGALSAGQSMVLLNFANLVGEVTGFKDWFNTLVAGDPDGFCFKGCEYKQRATISLEMRSREGERIGAVSATAGAEDRKLMPLPLIEAALGAVLDEFGNRSQQADAGTKAALQ
jgi:hypothetical protein